VYIDYHLYCSRSKRRRPLVARKSLLRTHPACLAQASSVHRAPADAACAALHAAALDVDSRSLEAGTMDVSRR